MPAVLPDSAKLRTVKAELERGLQSTRPAFLKWCIDKLSALPTQSADGINAALWADNVIDVCGEFPEDVLQSVTLDLLRSCTFRSSPAEIFKAADAKRGLRQRMLKRVNLMLRGGKPDHDAPAEKPIATRLGRLEHTRAIYARLNRTVDVHRIDREIAKERGEEIPGPSFEGANLNVERPPFVPATGLSAKRCAELAQAHRTGKPAPEWRDVPEVA